MARNGTSRFVDLGRYLCEVRAGQYWRLDNLKSFDEFLERKFPESQAQGLLPDGHPRTSAADSESRTCRSMGWTKATELAKVARRERQELRLCTLGAQGPGATQGGVQAGSREAPDREGNRAVGDPLFQGLQEPVAGDRAGARNGRR